MTENPVSGGEAALVETALKTPPHHVRLSASRPNREALSRARTVGKTRERLKLLASAVPHPWEKASTDFARAKISVMARS